MIPIITGGDAPQRFNHTSPDGSYQMALDVRTQPFRLTWRESIATFVKRIIMFFAFRRLIPTCTAGWLIRALRLKHA
jgi:hypothetical protein